MHHDSGARSSGLVMALIARSLSLSFSAIRAAQLSGGSATTAVESASSVGVGAGHISSNASAVSRENATTSLCSSRAAVLCIIEVNRSRWGTSATASSRHIVQHFLHFEKKKKQGKEEESHQYLV